MTQINKNIPRSPKHAARRRAALDMCLDAGFFKALGDPSRLRILSCVARCARACSVTEISECCAIDFSVVSRHLAILARAGVLQGLKRGRTVFYEVRYQELMRRFTGLARAIGACGCNVNKEGCCVNEETQYVRINR